MSAEPIEFPKLIMNTLMAKKQITLNKLGDSDEHSSRSSLKKPVAPLKQKTNDLVDFVDALKKANNGEAKSDNKPEQVDSPKSSKSRRSVFQRSVHKSPTATAKTPTIDLNRDEEFGLDSSEKLINVQRYTEQNKVSLENVNLFKSG